jgi:transglutaminase-like putative cysteine protease
LSRLAAGFSLLLVALPIENARSWDILLVNEEFAMTCIRGFVCLSVLGLLGWAPTSHAASHPVGLWQMNTPGVGESKLYLTTTEGKLRAEEFGLGYANGTPRAGKNVTCKDGSLVAHFETDGIKGYWALHLNPDFTHGSGKAVFTHYPENFGFGIEQDGNGRRVRVVKGVTVKRLSVGGFGDDWTIETIPSHRATYTREWKYTWPDHESKRWIIALRYAPETPWSKDAKGTAELLTSGGWKAFKDTHEESIGKRRMLRIDYGHDDPKLKHGFTIRTTVTATICEQKLKKGKPSEPVTLSPEERSFYLRETSTYDFDKPNVKKWMDEHKMWRDPRHEGRMTFALRVRRELIDHIPYDTKDGGAWICSQILKSGFGECCRHGNVGTSILRANKIPARTMCAMWAIDDQSKGGHCWLEVYLEGVGWVTCDSTGKCVGDKPADHLAGMVDFDWEIDAGPFGKQTLGGIDAWPAFWSEGTGSMEKSDCKDSERVHVLRRFR